MSNDELKVAQLKRWLDSYLSIARAYLNKAPSTNIILYFLTAPPEMIKVHCSTSNFKTLGMANGDFLYNGPSTVSNGLTPQLYCMKNGALVPVLKYSNFFAATLISVNPEYIAGKEPTIKAQEVVTYNYVDRNGGELTGPLKMPIGWIPQSDNDLVTKSYVDTLRQEIETRLGLIETRL